MMYFLVAKYDCLDIYENKMNMFLYMGAYNLHKLLFPDYFFTCQGSRGRKSTPLFY
jgi:hypothetical protein